MRDRAGTAVLPSPLRVAAGAVAVAGLAAAQVPNWTPTYLLNRSTIIQTCNQSGLLAPQAAAGWGIVELDWSNAKAMWAAAKPMDCEELLIQQAAATAAATPGSRVWVYRNSIKALPWYTTVRAKLEDPAYAAWHMRFNPANTTPYHVPPCDDNYTPPLCSALYHDQVQTPELPKPGHPAPDGACSPPACDVGTVPVGEYLWDPRAWNVSVHNVTLGQWWIDDYLFGPSGLGSELVSGAFFDDEWDPLKGPSEMDPHAVEDMGLSPGELADIAAAYASNMRQVFAAVVARGKFSWQQMWGGQADGAYAPNGARPLVRNTTAACIANLTSMCAPGSPAQARAMLYAFSPGGDDRVHSPRLPYLEHDVASFMLVRGPHAWLGHGWLGCNQDFAFPPLLDADFGEPLGLCAESAPGSGVFVREWTRATVSLDCNTWTPSIVFKQ